jgi:hypothetical protein
MTASKTKVRVYRNLHKNCFSIQTYIKGKGWRVTSRERSVLLLDVSFKVYKTGQKKVRREKRKNVHAFIVGELVGFTKYVRKNSTSVAYNPYAHDEFFTLTPKTRVKKDDVFESESACLWFDLENKAHISI